MSSERFEAKPLKRPRRTLVWINLAAVLLLSGWTALIGAGVLLGWSRQPLARTATPLPL